MINKFSMREAFGEELLKLGDENKKIIVLDADVSSSTRTVYFAKKYPERFFNVGIAEQNMMSMAAGFASLGLIPIVNTFAVFATRKALNEMVANICYTKQNVKICGHFCGLTVGEDGATHQSIEDLGIVRTIPNIKVVVPSDPYDIRVLLKEIINNKGPVYFRVQRCELPFLDIKRNIKLGNAEILVEGKDVTIFATGIMVNMAFNVVKGLRESSIDAELINITTIKPLDTETVLRSIRKTKCAVTCENHSIINGLGGSISQIAALEFPIPIEFIGINDCFCQSGKIEDLWCKYGLVENKISSAILKLLKRKSF